MIGLFSRASDDVKLSLIMDCLPKLSVKKILSDMSEAEKEVTSLEDLGAATCKLVNFVDHKVLWKSFRSPVQL